MSIFQYFKLTLGPIWPISIVNHDGLCLVLIDVPKRHRSPRGYSTSSPLEAILRETGVTAKTACAHAAKPIELLPKDIAMRSSASTFESRCRRNSTAGAKVRRRSECG